MASDLGYLRIPDDTMVRPEEISRYTHDQVILLTTGSQGEPTSALVRITNRDNPQIRIIPGDTVIMSATPVPGNEALVNRTIDNLFRQGAHVIYERLSQVHVHGHGSQEELKLLISLVRPKFFMPIHGEYRHLFVHADLAEGRQDPRCQDAAPGNSPRPPPQVFGEERTASGAGHGRVSHCRARERTDRAAAQPEALQGAA